MWWDAHVGMSLEEQYDFKEALGMERVVFNDLDCDAFGAADEGSDSQEEVDYPDESAGSEEDDDDDGYGEGYRRAWR